VRDGGGTLGIRHLAVEEKPLQQKQVVLGKRRREENKHVAMANFDVVMNA
jgi:hypothetical protein